MQTKQHSIWWPRLATFLLWVAAGASLAFWILKWPGMGTKLPAVGVASIGGPAPTDTQAVARLLGMGAAAPALPTPGAASRYALMGVVAGSSGAGVALISVDGKAARPFEVGAAVDAQLVLQSVASRQAVLAGRVEGPAAVTLELPPMKRLPSPVGVDAIPPVKSSPFEGNRFKPSLTDS